MAQSNLLSAPYGLFTQQTNYRLWVTLTIVYGRNCYQLLTMDESQFQEGDKPHHIQISNAFQTYLLIPGLLLLAVLGKVLDKYTHLRSSRTNLYNLAFKVRTLDMTIDYIYTYNL